MEQTRETETGGPVSCGQSGKASPVRWVGSRVPKTQGRWSQVAPGGNVPSQNETGVGTGAAWDSEEQGGQQGTS